MKILEPLFKNVISELIENNVIFILIGGYAVNYYGYGRYTGDIDIWIKPDNENKIRLTNAFLKLDRNKDDIEKIKKLDFTEAQTISIGNPPLRIDFLTKINLINFEEAWEKRVMWTLDNNSIAIIDFQHLLLSKFNTGRAKDKSDIEELQKIKNRKET